MTTASTTTIDPPRPTFAPTCPDWCRLPAGHNWDAYDPNTGIYFCGHAGPNFGHISVGAQETSDGRLTLDSMSDDNTDLTPEQWRDVARDALAAAEWLEAHQ